MFRDWLLLVLAVLVGMLGATPAMARPEKGEGAPDFDAVDIHGNAVDLDTLTETNPDLVILFFFTVSTGEDIAVKLRYLDTYCKGKLRIAAIGFKEDKDALEKFAQDLGVEFYVVPDTPEMDEKYGPFTALPLTFIVTDQRTILKILEGSGDAEAKAINDEVMNYVAEAYLQQRKLTEAKAIADEAVKTGADEKAARATKGFALVLEGKLDEAQAEFGRIDSAQGAAEGLARVALERGEYEKAVELAPDTGYGETVKGAALMRSGKLEEAAAAFEDGAAKPAADWQKSEAKNGQGRVLHEMGDTDQAVDKYQEAVALDPYNVVALSNEGAVHREKRDYKKAEEVLEKAQRIRDDDLVTVMLQQVQKEMEEANDIERGKLIRAQIEDLRKRYEELKAAGKDKPVDEWTSPPLVLAFLPSARSGNVVFDRAGMDVVLRRGIEAGLQGEGSIDMVEREVLDTLLQELNIGSSELVNQDTQLQLGKVLSARMLGFIDYAQVGGDTVMYLRLVDTETTALAEQLTKRVDEAGDIQALVDDVVGELVAKIADGRQLQGLIADASSEDSIIINLGARHGVKAGQRFNVIESGPPIEAGGKVIGYRQAKTALLEVTEVNEYALCKVVKKQEGATLAKEMRVKQATAR